MVANSVRHPEDFNSDETDTMSTSRVSIDAKGTQNLPLNLLNSEVGTIYDSTEDPESDPDVILGHLLKQGESAWTEEEEKTVTRKTDWRIMIWACCMFFSLELDRANISNVLTTNFLQNLHMTTQTYNLGHNCLSDLLLGHGDSVADDHSVFWPRGLDSSDDVRLGALLGICEGGFIPGLVLYLSSFYKSHELAIRFSWIWGESSFTDIVSALLAAGILQMKDVHGWYDWQWLFLLEGILTAVIGLATAVMLPSVRSKHISRIYSPREVAILRAKVILDDDSKARGLERGRHLHINIKTIFLSLFDRYLFPIYLLGFSAIFHRFRESRISQSS
ncbi:hypothetical protein V1525DRAFT_431365 [Lipomyces kononenkoae]|uniref:Uncharacterized protein n=1 Tax=Lipomyces kononenkoae TaxID=34357 RepID=A0ACC3T597_LIPKO